MIDTNYKLLDEFEVTLNKLGIQKSEIAGYVEGFIFTTDFMPSKGFALSKNEVEELWQQFRRDKRLWKLNDNHRLDMPHVGYITSAKLYGVGDWLGVFGICAITTKKAIKRFESGELGGFSIGIKKRASINEDLASEKVAGIVVEKNSYSPKQIEKFKKALGEDYRVTVNEVYKFSELPPLVVEIAINIDIKNIVAVLATHPAKSALIAGGGILVKKVLEMIVEDAYRFVKKAAKQLFTNKSKRKPILLIKTELLGKIIYIRSTSKSEADLVESIARLKSYIGKLPKNKLVELIKANKIVASVEGKKTQIVLDDGKKI